jgi:hypothetical protein
VFSARYELCLCKTVRFVLEIFDIPQFLLANSLLVVQFVRVNCATCLANCLPADGAYSYLVPRCLSLAVFCVCGDSWRCLCSRPYLDRTGILICFK